MRCFPEHKPLKFNMISARPQQIQRFLLDQIPDHPRDIVSLTAETFNVTRTTVHRHLGKLIRSKDIIKSGTTNGASYYLKSAVRKNLSFEIKPDLDEQQVWRDCLAEPLSVLPDNVYSICEYSFGVIFNNVLEHSAGRTLRVLTAWQGDSLQIDVLDDGLGIFRKLQATFNLASEREAVLQLIKGRLTTDPQQHTGEGIFFTSRLVDRFFIWSYDLSYYQDNLEDDWFIETRAKALPGTGVSLLINKDCTRTLAEVFARYTTEDAEGIPRFDRTHILVELSRFGEERYVSRSQAKRLLLGLDKFKHVIMDFKNVRTVGQGFVDEVFRGFRNRHPHIKLEFINVSEDVQFMIEHGLPDPAGHLGKKFLYRH